MLLPIELAIDSESFNFFDPPLDGGGARSFSVLDIISDAFDSLRLDAEYPNPLLADGSISNWCSGKILL